MNARTMKLGLLCMGMLFVLIGTVSASQCVNPSDTSLTVLSVGWGNATQIVSPGPGSTDVPLTITLQSSGSTCTMENVQGTLQLGISGLNGVAQPGEITYFNGSTTGIVNVQSEAPYSTFTLTFPLNLNSSISPGPYTSYQYPLYVSWTYQDNVSSKTTQQFSISIPVRGSPDLLFNSRGSSLVAGQVNNITISVSNIGTGTATGVSIPVPTSSGLELLSQPEHIASLAPGGSANLTLSVFVPPTLGGQGVSLSPYYYNPFGYNVSVPDGLPLYVLPAQGTINVTASTGTLTAGTQDDVILYLTNYGVAPIRNMSVTITPGSSLSLLDSDGVVNVPYIPAGGVAGIPLTVYPSSSSTITSISVTMDYSAGSITRSLSFLTPGYVDLSVVSSSVLPTTPEPGAIFSLTSTLDNIGTATAQAVSVSPIPPAGISILGQNTTFVGSMGVYTPTAFTLSFTSSSSLSAGLYKIPVVIKYINNLDQQVSTTLYYTVNVGVSSSGVTASQGNTTVAQGSGAEGAAGSGNYPGNYMGGGRYFVRNTTAGGSAASGNAGASFGGPPGGYRGGTPIFLYIIVGGVVVAVIAVGTFLLVRRRRAKREKSKQGAHHQ